MSVTTTYVFFDRVVMDPVWRWSWKEFFRRHPRSRSEVSKFIKFGFNSEREKGNEPSDEELAEIFETKTIAWTLRRSTPPFAAMEDVMGVHLRGGPRGSCVVETISSEDCLALAAAGIDGWMRGVVGERTLQAILKLHSFEALGHWLDLPRRLVAQVKRLTSPKVLSKPLYNWQGPDACLYSPFGFTDYERDNCLNVADTRRFMAFLEQAWEENRRVPFLNPDTKPHIPFSRDMSVDLATNPSPKFREVELARGLVARRKAVLRFKTPCAFRYLC